MAQRRKYNAVYTGARLNHVAFPLGGMGAGMICLEGRGAISHVSVRNRPDIFNEPCMFSAICVRARRTIARVLEGPVPARKIFGNRGSGNGALRTTFGLPRFSSSSFRASFPFATIVLEDQEVPLIVEITSWSPFIPGDADNSSLPVAALEYRFRNVTSKAVEAVYSFNSTNFMSTGSGGERILSAQHGFTLWQPGSPEKPWEQGSFCASVRNEGVTVNHAWFHGEFFDSLTLVWKNIEEGNCLPVPPVTDGTPPPGASICLPLKIAPYQAKTVTLTFSWYVPETDLSYSRCEGAPGLCAPGGTCCKEPVAKAIAFSETYKPWYSARFPSIDKLTRYWVDNYNHLRDETRKFSECLSDTTLPPEVIEAIAVNLTILKSPTVLRQADGRLWSWEGCSDDYGCCAGSCTHVWNYAQVLPHLFPALERRLRQVEFNESQDEKGHQSYRAALPIGPAGHYPPSACDGQLGGIIKAYREWRISADSEWLRSLWPRVKKSLDYCIATWDPGHMGVLVEPHENTYDVAFWGPDSMCSGFYLAALKAAMTIGAALDDNVSLYTSLFQKGRKYFEEVLWNGEYFEQKVQWQGLRTESPVEVDSVSEGKYSPEALELVKKEGPKYQYGRGCLSDGLTGAWLAAVCGIEEFLDKKKVRKNLLSVYKHNFKKDLSQHANPERPGFACGKEAGLLLCTWPKGGRPSLPFPYCDEVWTGVEYKVASHLILEGMVCEGLEIVRACRDRYDGTVRNPFDEYECGHWYARAMSSYSLLQALTGVRYDAVDKTLHINPRMRGDFRSFLSTATGYGTVGVRRGRPFVEVKSGYIAIQHIKYRRKK